jgi:hypothetical protein
LVALAFETKKLDLDLLVHRARRLEERSQSVTPQWSGA